MAKESILNKKPLALVFAGPNGSGKSTITKHFTINMEYTNADDVVAATGIDNKEAAKQVDARRYRAIDDKRDFSFETVLSSEYKMDLLRYAKSKGYFIKCFFILTKDPSLNIARVKARVLVGGHNVEPTTIRKRYWKSLKNIRELMEICDILHVYDNTRDEPIRIIRKHKDDILYLPNDVWSLDEIINLANGKYSG